VNATQFESSTDDRLQLIGLPFEEFTQHLTRLPDITPEDIQNCYTAIYKDGNSISFLTISETRNQYAEADFFAGAEDFAEMRKLSWSLREKLQEKFVVRPKVVANSDLCSVDGTRKWLLQFPDKNSVESM
jgi:hypothetical protein